MQVARFSNLNDFPAAMWSFNDTVNRLLAADNQSQPWSPPVDIFETDNELIFQADAPDLNPGHIEIQVENGTLTLKGERSLAKDDRVKGYHRMERSYGSFIRSFHLPETLDAESARADYAEGVLTVTLAKKAVAKARTIKINLNKEPALTGQASTT
jgi:HSP20 family protein